MREMQERRPHRIVHAAVADAGCRPSADLVPASGFHTGRTYKVRGLCCADEVAALRRAVGPLVGGAERLAFDVLNGRMSIADDAGHVAEETIVKAVAGTGM